MERRLAAILAADVVGYSRLIRADEEGTLAALKALRADLIDPKIAQHHGRIVNLMGDGMLAEFASVVDAVRAAVETQRAVTEHNSALPEDRRIEFRVGINLGDVVIDGDDIHGDGVNVAARLEGLSEPGGICISGKVYEEVRDRIDLAFEDLGEREVKNIDRPVRAWRWLAEVASLANAPPTSSATIALPDKPSIAVLPFDNMSRDPEQEYFADGMTEDIITGLSKFGYLFVIARNSTFTYKGQAIDIRTVAGDLGVRYVLEGSIRRDGARVRVTSQLIDADTGNHLWAERYDRALVDIFDVQDEVTAAIVGAIAPEIDQAEFDRAKRKPPESLDAWGLIQKGLAQYGSGELDDLESAISFFDAAREADPNFAEASAIAAHARLRTAFHFPQQNKASMVAEADRLLQTALRQDPGNLMCILARGWLHYHFDEPELAILSCREAVARNPNWAQAYHELVFSSVWRVSAKVI